MINEEQIKAAIKEKKKLYVIARETSKEKGETLEEFVITQLASIHVVFDKMMGEINEL